MTRGVGSAHRRMKEDSIWSKTGDFPPELQTIHHIIPRYWYHYGVVELVDGRVLKVTKDTVARIDWHVALPSLTHAYCHWWWSQMVADANISDGQRWAEAKMLEAVPEVSRVGYGLIVSQYSVERPWVDPFFGRVNLDDLLV